MSRIRKHIPGVDPQLLIRDAAKLMPDPTRRLFLRGGASLGALSFLAGCDSVDGSSADGKRTGTPLREFLRRVGADTRAKYVWFRCAEGYSTSIDMATALHPQTQMTFRFDGEILPRKYGFPMKVRMPTKLGFKNPKHVMEIAVTDKYLGGYWEDQGYNWFSGS